MRNNKAIDLLALGTTIAAIGTLYFLHASFGPPLDRPLHAAIGRALARETLKLLPPGGKVTLIARNTEAYPQPTMDALVRAIRKELEARGAAISQTHWIDMDPLRPVEVPPGDFFELIRRGTADQVIVSLLGPPMLTVEQRARLGRPRPKIVAFCTDNRSAMIDLRQLFDAGLLHAAIVNRPLGGGTMSNGIKDPFERLYAVMKPGELSGGTAVSVAAR